MDDKSNNVTYFKSGDYQLKGDFGIGLMFGLAIYFGLVVLISVLVIRCCTRRTQDIGLENTQDNQEEGETTIEMVQI